MGKNERNLILLSGFQIDDNNRGSAALGYGSIPFLLQKRWANKRDKFCMLSRIRFYRRVWKNLIPYNHMKVDGVSYKIKYVKYFQFEYYLFLNYRITFPFSPFRKLVRHIKLVAATNGGDGLADIYGIDTFNGRLRESKIAMKLNSPLIIMPQTIGPFSDESIRKVAVDILKYAKIIYVRDEMYKDDLQKIGLKYELEKDLSSYMKPEPFDIKIAPNAVGVNVSGLAYSNNFKRLSGQFKSYPELIDAIIDYFKHQGLTIYLIPHSYNYFRPERDNDDLLACRQVYERLADKTRVILLNKNLRSPQIKFVISKMKFFVGTRMHANFAAIYSGVPVFGLGYSYKFRGAFEASGLSPDRTYIINNMPDSEISHVVDMINHFYLSVKPS